MESSIAVPVHEQATGSTTLADLIGLAAARHGDATAIRHKRDGAWHDVSYAALGDTVSEIGRGLIDLGIEPGRAGGDPLRDAPRVDLRGLRDRRHRRGRRPDLPDELARGVRVGGRQLRRPGDRLRGRRAGGEDRARAGEPPRARDGDRRSIRAGWTTPGCSRWTRCASAGGRATPAELDDRARAVTRDQPFTIIYTSGTTGPPKGCVLSHGNYRDVVSMCERDAIVLAGDVAYLFLPLAHSFALLIQLAVLDMGATLAYVGGGPKEIIVELSEVRPTYLPSVPRIFEKLYTLVTAHGDPDQIRAATQVGLKVRALQAAGEEVPAELQAHFDGAEEALFKNVRAAFGGRLRQATSGAAPIATEILEFFFACGVPVLEGYGMTETATAATASTIHNYRFGSVGRPLAGQEVRIAEDGEVLLKGPNIFQGYYRNDDASFGAIVDGWLHTGDLGRVDEDGFLFITGRKKDIIITAGGKNLTPANLENDLKQSRWISQAVMHGDRRPYPVALITLDPEEIVVFAREQGLPEDPAALSREPAVIELIQGELDRVNERYAQVEKIKRFALLEHDLSQETGELTPTLKVKRNVVNEKYADVIDALYEG